MRTIPSLGANPIIVKELRSRMREARAFFTLTGVLVILGIVSYLIYRMVLATTSFSPTPVSPQIGQTLFLTLAFLELLMVCSIGPAVTAGAISSEQEKLTYEMLMATPLRPASILWGKLVSALSYVFLLIFAAIPMASLIFIFGGVSLRDMAKALIILVTVAVTFGVFGLFMSALFKRTSRATVLTYLVVGLLLFGTIFVYMALGVIRQAEPPRWILIPNPISALVSALAPSVSFENSPISSFWYWGMNFGGGIRMLGGTTISQTSIPRPIYHYSLPLYAGLTLLLYMLSTRLVRTTRRWHIGWQDALIALGSLGAFGGVVVLAFVGTADRYENVSIFTAPTPVPIMMEPPVVVEQVVPAIEVVDAPTPTPFDPGTNSEIYAVAIRQLVVDFFGEDRDEISNLYILNQTDDSIGDPNTPLSDSQTVSDPLREGITNALEGGFNEIIWIDDRSTVPVDGEFNQVVDGAILVLGNLHMVGGGNGTVSASIETGNLAGMGKTYTVDYIKGTWQVTGDTGFIWER